MYDLSVVQYSKDITKLLTDMGAKRVCEVGVLRGRGIRRMNVPCVELIVGIDMWGPYDEKNNYDLDACYVQAHKVRDEVGRTILIRSDSASAASFFSDGFFDLVYIDADHTYEAVKNDIREWWPKVRNGGVLSGHDYVDKSDFGDQFGVIQAVDEFTADNNLAVHLTKDRFASWFTNKE